LPTTDPAAAVRRSAASVPFRQLAHRRAKVLLGPEDGIGDLSIVLGHFEPGPTPGHVHWPGGEALYVVDGEGEMWIEGRQIPLQRGVAAYTGPCIEHHIENIGDGDLVIIGAFSPSAVPGSYKDREPIRVPTGQMASVDHLWRRVRPDAVTSGAPILVQALIDDPGISPHSSLRLVRIRRGGRFEVTASSGPRAYVSLAGSGTVSTPSAIAGPVGEWDVIGIAQGLTLVVEATEDMTLLEAEGRYPALAPELSPCE
jgi:quercetin dioxygenase-like cupin family protein